MAGTIDAPSVEMAGNHLYQTGYFPIAIEEKISFGLTQPIRPLEKISKGEVGRTDCL